MDILQACEDLANNIASFNPFECSDAEISKEQIQRWQHLFGSTEEEAIKELGNWRADFGRTSIPSWLGRRSARRKHVWDTNELYAVINRKDKDKLLANLPAGSSATIIPISRDRKDLSHNSAYPTLGLDTTLPQNRPYSPIVDHEKPQPGNEDYPVWYFFYGTLADFWVPTTPFSLIPAWTIGGRIGTWAGKYKALVDDFGGGRVYGYGFLVQDKEAEDALRYYETGAYEVVRCEIYLETNGGVNMVKGLTFRFASGSLEE
ncbi:unnamed protein product [Clonostachys rosea f. rosea IK726]|uniref:Uncharacterized protein n=1 Tax=Clonostachys rosea f. rosea IK726 TaxID=1349383 RepID=A0ACA9UHL0_BIOOC|nr:unnamed protein product [Clonostachys rosea f. rosea IK726]